MSGEKKKRKKNFGVIAAKRKTFTSMSNVQCPVPQCENRGLVRHLKRHFKSQLFFDPQGNLLPLEDQAVQAAKSSEHKSFKRRFSHQEWFIFHKYTLENVPMPKLQVGQQTIQGFFQQRPISRPEEQVAGDTDDPTTESSDSLPGPGDGKDTEDQNPDGSDSLPGFDINS